MMTDSKQKKIENAYIRAAQHQEKSYIPLKDQMTDSAYGVWNQEHSAIADLNTLKGIYFNDEWAYILIDRIASKIAPLPLRVMKSKGYKNGVLLTEPDEKHSLVLLLENPNKYQTSYQFVYNVVADYCIAGNAIIWYSRVNNTLVHVPVEMVMIDTDIDGNLSHYRLVQMWSEGEIPIFRDIRNLAPKDVGHARMPNPSSALWGLSKLVPARKSVLFNRYSLEYLNNFYIKGAQPGLVFELSENANEASALKLLRTAEQTNTGRRNQRRNMILPKGVKASSFNHTLSDQQLKDYIDQNRETLINVFQVPKHELSIAEAGSLGSQEHKIALRNFWNGPLYATRKSIEQTLTKLFQPELGADRWLEFDVSDVAALQEDLHDKADLAAKMLVTHTVNEIRGRIYDDGPIEGGDQLASQSAPPAFNPFMSMIDRAQESSSVSENHAMMQEIAQPELEQVSNNELTRSEFNLKAVDDKLFYKGFLNFQTKALDDEIQEKEPEFIDIVLDIFADQVADVVEIMRDHLMDTGYSEKSYRVKNIEREALLKRKIENALNEYTEVYVNESYKTLQRTVDAGYDFQVRATFKGPDESRIEALREQSRATMQERLESRGFETFKNINETTTNRMLKRIANGVENNRTIDQIAEDLFAGYKEEIGDTAAGRTVREGRARTIARTEILTASSIGSKAAMDNMSELVPNLKKMWINAGDERVRGHPSNGSVFDHWTIGGQIVDHDKNFSNGLEYPRDGNGEAGQVINCRCSMILVPADEAEEFGLESFGQQMEREITNAIE